MGLLLLLAESGFDIRSQLFAAGEAGAWYDPSDLSSMWQDAAGNTPVTATSDPVGLILDKSRSAPSMGANQIANGVFATDSDWTKGTGWSIGSGVATKAAGSAALLSQAQTMTAGRYYIVTYTITRTAGTITAQFTGGSTVSGTARSASGTYTDIITAVSGNNTVEFSADASFAGTVDDVSVKVLSAGNHAYQVTSGARPSLSISSGLSALSFDGSDDFLVSNAIDFSATDEMSVFCGIRKLADGAFPTIAEASAVWASNNGSFAFSGNSGSGYAFSSRGTGGTSALVTGFLAPVSSVVTGLSKIATPSVLLRVNGTQVGSSTSTQGLGNYGSHAVYIGRRAGTTSPMNGLIYQLVFRNKSTTGSLLTAAEREVARKSGVSI
jgi:hypothetical protein